MCMPFIKQKPARQPRKGYRMRSTRRQVIFMQRCRLIKTFTLQEEQKVMVFT